MTRPDTHLQVHNKSTRAAEMKRAFEETEGDNNPFHVTNMLTTRADGTCPIPPVLIHSNPGTKSKTDECKLTNK